MLKHLVSFSIVVILLSCKSDDVVVTDDAVIEVDLITIQPGIQRQIDIDLMDNYILDNGYSDFEIDTTISGARYIIIDYGDTLLSDDRIEENDSVEFIYTGKTVDNLIFSTSVDTIAQDEGLRREEFISILYTESGENIENVFIKGFAEGIVKTFKKVGSNSHVILLLPSDLSFGDLKRVFPKAVAGEVVELPANSVTIWDVFPKKVVQR